MIVLKGILKGTKLRLLNVFLDWIMLKALIIQSYRLTCPCWGDNAAPFTTFNDWRLFNTKKRNPSALCWWGSKISLFLERPGGKQKGLSEYTSDWRLFIECQQKISLNLQELYVCTQQLGSKLGRPMDLVVFSHWFFLYPPGFVPFCFQNWGWSFVMM